MCRDRVKRNIKLYRRIFKKREYIERYVMFLKVKIKNCKDFF